MIWNKYEVEDRKLQGISVLAIVMMLISLYMQSKLVLFLGILFLAIAAANQLYLKKAGERLYVDYSHDKARFFIDEKGKWSFIIRNDGYPILKAELRVFFDYFVAPESEESSSSRGLHEISIPISIFTGQTKQISIPFTANTRGIAKIRRLEFQIPSFLGFGETALESKLPLTLQAIIYPQPIPVKGLAEQLSKLQGANIVPYSVYENRLGPLGTRDYVASDSFNAIHWKASARKQSLQTKLYEKISETGWTVALNISDGHSINGNLEGLISSITEFAYFAFHKQLSYAMCINVRSAGNTPFLYLPKGDGGEHLQKVLETLASINRLNTSIPYDQMLSFYSRHLESQPFFIHTGIRTQEGNDQLLFIQSQKGVRLFELKLEEENGVLTKLEVQNESRKLL
ncbi:DUF58 domain-containing protein [Neobacillus niacini]|uniref:DUF58 domain-containing protein n=1 Tax=Neobacillus niacini TaxID=86668 RepID=UPI0021CB0BAD|nr:DUF58 domain-containing protein [Neobacillus niacini]MCM3767416.1 DUF58 domain-containing protein [Neobacillus niacini]